MDPTAAFDPTDDAHAVTVTTRPGWAYLEAYGVTVAVFPSPTGAPVVEVGTAGIAENAAGPIMRLSLNDHDYLANAEGTGTPMTPDALAAAGLESAIGTVAAALGRHGDGPLFELLEDAGVVVRCGCGARLGPAEQVCPECGAERATATDPAADWCDHCGRATVYAGHVCTGCGRVWGYELEPAGARVSGTVVLQRWEGDQAVEVACHPVVLPGAYLATAERAVLEAAVDDAGARDRIVEELGLAGGHDGPFELTLDVDEEGTTTLARWLVAHPAATA